MNQHNQNKIDGLGTWPEFEKGVDFYVPMGVIIIELQDCSNYTTGIESRSPLHDETVFALRKDIADGHADLTLTPKFLEKNNTYNKTIKRGLKFSGTILAIGPTAITNVHAQVDGSTNPDDPSCQSSGGSTSLPNYTLCKITVTGGAIILGHPELSPLGQIICEP